ncbi:MAG: ribonuclease HI [Candidatus Schekmanbacteria bacterium RIFCSPHIGHO2_02_FULL_38_11]|uniref:Ribonuclease H n=1 Tax=Candidatus Schekmanbacteria bacterium RIFCSPLOWO2_12_FULL_38_15 TaxID=1817883 RepID=A0A1F7SHW8_9BACT|nr:MAG: ribonuclease HI [Candidatus Schekmanbacteria bacterium RIFCSPLOWO2_02_FULL_38_14]OGL53321.1 MAG: ribonuclease HI [Candidatus Schekmanbacteria bacterium RIFCSPLOWO2_12_FULL_38_15]OGL54794.1 MAG: ribonuclease HI [Candidatus Schekmanbacteria bacterium RIFCSPHIGHO2_02_FULL_38_11]
MQEITIYCDGACSGNPGPGGFGYIIKKSCKSAEFKGGSPATTNNRMELIAAIKAIEKIKHHSKITVVSDSQYLVKGMTEWIFGWQKRGWINSQKDPVKNKDLWLKLLELSKKHNIKWEWIKGHDGHPENERCDELAREYIEKIKSRKS